VGLKNVVVKMLVNQSYGVGEKSLCW